jgi:hypothetical protein
LIDLLKYFKDLPLVIFLTICKPYANRRELNPSSREGNFGEVIYPEFPFECYKLESLKKLLPLMKQLEKTYAGLRVFSLTTLGDATPPMHIELGVCGDPGQIEPAFAKMCKEGYNRLISSDTITTFKSRNGVY